MPRQKEIKFRDQFDGLVGRQNGIVFVILTEPGAIASAPAHWVTAIPKDSRPTVSTLGHQYFNLAEARNSAARSLLEIST